MTPIDPAVTAATAAIEFEIDRNMLMHLEGNLGGGTDQRGLASVAVAAARPIIEAEVRERIAADIEAHRVDPGNEGIIRAAARIARGGSHD